ncbi:MAG: DsrE family protein [Gammaproteobacteria bacterium]|nr:DsrE family protein [Gammaproteobacteria bacterium]
MVPVTKSAALVSLLLLVLQSSLLMASNQHEINLILSLEEPPFGVVFEIVEGGNNDLDWAIPLTNGFIKQLRKRFPEIDIAVVSHGSEQFALLKSEATERAEVHQAVQSLVASDVPVHVCGTHASWRHKVADDFPDYVDVTPAGPTKIRDYQFMGYTLIKIDRE